MHPSLELLIHPAEGRTQLLSPGVGLFTRARPRGELLSAGAEAGVLLTLGRPTRLLVPPGVEGRILSERPERVLAPVGYKTPLYELAPIAAAQPASTPEQHARQHGTALLFRSPQSGRFYHRPTPDAPPFVTAGSIVTEGDPIGLIEVMKTFAHLAYRAASSLPERARILRILVADGAEIAEGEPLLELESAVP